MRDDCYIAAIASVNGGWGAVVERDFRAIEYSQHSCSTTAADALVAAHAYVDLQLPKGLSAKPVVWIQERPTFGAASQKLYDRALLLAHRAAAGPKMPPSERFARSRSTAELMANRHPPMSLPLPEHDLRDIDLGAVVLAPCARVGGVDDWWTKKHTSCTGSRFTPIGFVWCACSCHKNGENVISLVKR